MSYEFKPTYQNKRRIFALTAAGAILLMSSPARALINNNYTAISPAEGYNTYPKLTVSISNYFPHQANVSVTLGGVAATNISFNGTSNLICDIDLSAVSLGSKTLAVTADSDPGFTIPNAFNYKAMAARSAAPSSGYRNSGVSITNISGEGFIGTPEIKLLKTGETAITATNVVFVSSTSLSCNADLTGAATGQWSVSITTATLNCLLSDAFTVLPMAASSITPSRAYNTGKVSITELGGGGFSGSAQIKLSKAGEQDIAASNVALVNSSKLTCDLDLTGKTAGLWDVTVIDGAFSTTLAKAFEVAPAVYLTQTVDPAAASELKIVPASGEIKLDIPAGTFDQSVGVTFSTRPVPSSDNPAVKVGNVCFEITDSLGLQPKKPVTITMRYNDADITAAGLDESKLAVCRYDPVSRSWASLRCALDTANNLITAMVDHFSVFALVGLAPAANIDNLRAYPNPFNPASQSAGLTVSGLPAAAALKIYSTAGELVRTLNYASGNGQVSWDGKNDSGAAVASGVYIMLVKSGSDTKKLKIAVER